MSSNLRWKFLTVIAVFLIFAIVGVYPMAATRWGLPMPGWLAANQLKLGLDLKGGVHLVLRVQTDDALRLQTEQDMERLRAELMTRKLTVGNIESTGISSFRVEGVPPDRDAEFRQIAAEILVNFDRGAAVAGADRLYCGAGSFVPAVPGCGLCAPTGPSTARPVAAASKPNMTGFFPTDFSPILTDSNQVPPSCEPRRSGPSSSIRRSVTISRPRCHVVSTLNTSSAISSGNQPPCRTFVRFAAKNVRSTVSSAAAAGITSPSERPHSARTTKKNSSVSIASVPVTAIP